MSAENLLVRFSATTRRRHGRANWHGLQPFRNMQSNGAQGRVGKFWRERVYDRTCGFPEWQPHPHCRFKPIGRFLFAFMGSIVPVGMIVLASGVTTRLDRGSLLLGSTFWVGFVVAGVGWIVAVLAIMDT